MVNCMKSIFFSILFFGVPSQANINALDVSDQFGLQNFVKNAKSHIENNYSSAIADFRNNKMWRQKHWIHLFIIDKNGKSLFDPDQPSLEGTNILELTDLNAFKFVSKIIETANDGGGFINYVGGTKADELSIISYVEEFTACNDKTLIIGSVFYPEIKALQQRIGESIGRLNNTARELAKENIQLKPMNSQ